MPRVFFYSPHPDDETLSAGLGLVWYLAHGYEVHVVTMNRGENGGPLGSFNGSIILHAAALRRISAARLAVHDQAAGSESTAWSAERSGATITTLVFVGLLAAGVMANAERLVTAASSWVQSHQAESHLASVGEHESRRPEVATTFRATYDGRGLAVSGYQLPETPTRDAREITFAVAAGQTLVITGPSGSGKTTLITAIATALRQRPGPAVVTAVQADDYLFTGTVAKNLRLANPTANDAAVADLLTAMALDRAGVGPQTNLGVGGRSLSGGEQRRLHVARALATQPDVLLIDEPTTGVDTDTATQVWYAVRRRLPRAVLVVALHEPPPDTRPLGPNWTTVSVG